MYNYDWITANWRFSSRRKPPDLYGSSATNDGEIHEFEYRRESAPSNTCDGGSIAKLSNLLAIHSGGRYEDNDIHDDIWCTVNGKSFMDQTYIFSDRHTSIVLHRRYQPTLTRLGPLLFSKDLVSRLGNHQPEQPSLPHKDEIPIAGWKSHPIPINSRLSGPACLLTRADLAFMWPNSLLHNVLMILIVNPRGERDWLESKIAPSPQPRAREIRCNVCIS